MARKLVLWNIDGAIHTLNMTFGDSYVKRFVKFHCDDSSNDKRHVGQFALCLVTHFSIQPLQKEWPQGNVRTYCGGFICSWQIEHGSVMSSFLA